MRLTNAVRNMIKERALENLFPEKQETYYLHAIQQMMYHFIIKMRGKSFEGWEKFKQYMVMREYIFIRTPKHGEISVKLPAELPFQVSSDGYFMRSSQEFDISTFDTNYDLKNLLKEYIKFIDARYKAERTIARVLNSINITKQLIEIAPEMEQFIPEYESKALISMQTLTDLTSLFNKK